MVAPFIKTLAQQGGTFVTFSSSSEDLGLTFSNSANKFRFSKFVLLNIPNIATPAYANNTIQFGAIDGALIEGLDPDQNINFAQSFQNYALNLEAGLVTQTSYDRNIKLNVAERVFWKWMKEVGAIRFRNANSMETTTNTIIDPRYTEEQEILTGTNRYNRVVQYIGEIDIVNSVANNVNAYTELYIHVPTSDGNTPLVMFKTQSDVNYFPAQSIENRPINPLDDDVLFGRHYNDVHPAGLSINAFFDQTAINDPITTTNGNPSTHWWDPMVGPRAYFTDPVFSDTTNDTIYKILNSAPFTNVTFKRSNLDGITLDFNTLDYKPIVTDPRITTFNEFNSHVLASPFEFNAILVYYDVFDPNNTTDSATNLYGVLFLENIEQIATEYGIPRFAKFKPNIVTKLNGNSFGFKINLKFDTSVDNAGVEKAINDFSSFSMDLFVDTLNQLQSAVTTLTTQQQEFIDLNNRMLSLEDLVINVDNINEVNLRLATLEESFSTNQALFNNTQAVVDMINNVNSDLQNLIAGNTSITVAYNLNVVKSGLGIFVDRSVPNIIKLNSTVQGYSIDQTVPFQADLSAGGTIILQTFNNYFRHFTSGLTKTLTSDIFIKIDDTNVQWKRGQVYRIVFDDIVDPQTNSVIFQTDAIDRQGNGSYGIFIGSADATEFTPSGDRPIFDIMCIDDVNLTFLIDRIR